jgi:hypothetical protein
VLMLVFMIMCERKVGRKQRRKQNGKELHIILL